MMLKDKTVNKGIPMSTKDQSSVGPSFGIFTLCATWKTCPIGSLPGELYPILDADLLPTPNPVPIFSLNSLNPIAKSKAEHPIEKKHGRKVSLQDQWPCLEGLSSNETTSQNTARPPANSKNSIQKSTSSDLTVWPVAPSRGSIARGCSEGSGSDGSRGSEGSLSIVRVQESIGVL